MGSIIRVHFLVGLEFFGGLVIALAGFFFHFLDHGVGFESLRIVIPAVLYFISMQYKLTCLITPPTSG